MACEVQSLSDVKLLEIYETRLFRKIPCRIEFEDGREVGDRTFEGSSDRG